MQKQAKHPSQRSIEREWVVANMELTEDLTNDLAVIDFQSLAAGNFESTRIEAKLVHNGRMNIGYIMTILDRVKTNLVGCSVNEAPLNATAGHPH